MRRQILLNLVTGYAGKGLGALLGIFLIPFLIHKLGAAAFGITVLTESVIAVIEVASMSVRTALSRNLTFCLFQGKTMEFMENLIAGRRILFVLALLMLSVGTGISIYVPQFLRIPVHLVHPAQGLFGLMTASFTMTLLSIPYWSVLYANQRFDLINISYSAALLFRALCLFTAFSLLSERWLSLTTYGWIYFWVIALQNYFVYLSYRKVMPPDPRFAGSQPDRKAKEIFAFSFYTAFSNFNVFLCQALIQIMINILLGTAANALYAVGVKFSTTLRRIFQDSAWTLTPTVTALAAQNDSGRLKELFFGYVKFVTLALSPMGFFLIIFSVQILALWVGPEFLAAAPIMALHVAAMIVVLPFRITSSIYNAYAKMEVSCAINLGYTVLLLGISYAAIKEFQAGLLTVISLDAALNLAALGFGSYYACKIAKFSWRELWLKSFAAPALLAAGLWGTIFLFLSVWAPPLTAISLLLIITGLGFLAAVYVFLSFVVILDAREKEFVMSVLRKIKLRLTLREH